MPIPRLSLALLERSLRNSINSNYLLLKRNLERNTNARRSFELVRQEARIPVFFLNQLEAGELFSEDALDVFVDVSVLDGFAFVVFFFTTANSNLHFGIMLFIKKNAKWHNGKSFFFGLCFYLF